MINTTKQCCRLNWHIRIGIVEIVVNGLDGDPLLCDNCNNAQIIYNGRKKDTKYDIWIRRKSSSVPIIIL